VDIEKGKAMRIIVTGDSSGLGRAICEALVNSNCGHDVIGWSLHDKGICDDLPWQHRLVDVNDRRSILEGLVSMKGAADVIVNCAGVNHIDWFGNLNDSDWDYLMETNCKSIFNVVQEMLATKTLKEGGTVLNIVSNASHMPMTHSAAYNASKGAAEILTRQMARELGKTHKLTVFGISPNKLKGTGMSDYIDARVCELRGWTPEEAAEYQKQSLPAGEETDPAAVAEFIAFLLSTKDRHKYLNGCIIPYGA
jgi:NAD(P)-dependent dehydrogenase (short-subunit alcohol dehydrogenase family)